MNLEKIGYRPLLSWLSLAVLVVLVCVLGMLQYRWIGEISEIEQKKLQDALQSSLNAVSRDFNLELNSACAALVPTEAEVNEGGREAAYGRRYARSKESGHVARLFSRIALAWQERGELTLHVLDRETGEFTRANWPDSWSGLKARLDARLRHEPGGPPDHMGSISDSSLIDLPRFGGFDRGGPSAPGRGPGEQDWLLLEVDTGYVAGAVLPDLLARHLGNNYQTDYRMNVVARANPALSIYQSDSRQSDRNDGPAVASVTLFDVMPFMTVRVGPGPGGPGRGPGRRTERNRGPGPGGPDGPRFGGRGFDGPGPLRGLSALGDSGRGRWLLSIRLNAGSLETVVGRVRRRNIAVSAAILLLILITAAALVRFSRRAQRLAEIEMEFVASVSHELRTPLTVIRTAAFNLRGRLANNPSQVERYGNLIREESEKLTAIVEQVLQFSSAKRGHVIREREPLSVESLIEDSLQSSRGILEETLCEVEKKIEPGLPLISGDSMALRHALQNLVNNAVKYGMEGVKWIGIFARADGAMIEIKVADHGPGIPREEQRHVFDAFFRGKKAVSDQIHGTGLGLNLVKKIVEAHGGTVDVQSEPGAGTSFIVRIPAYQMDQKNELTNSLDRG